MGCLGEMTCHLAYLVINLIAFQRSGLLTIGLSDNLYKWYFPQLY